MSIKLLVADDSITIQKVIGIIFGGEEYSLTIVDNGKSAIEKAREVCPDVLLIDALMPGMTGYEVAEAVRATPSLANKPILILTGSFEPFDEDKAKKCGADDFLSKPFESQQIVNKVKELAELGASREMTTPTIQPFVPPAASVPPVIQTAFTETNSAPFFGQQAEMPQTFSPSDIWGAFTTDIEPPPLPKPAPAPASFAAAQSSTPFEFAAEPDVFAIVNEESDSQLVQPTITPGLSPQNTGSQWIPVEEHTFEFEEEIVSEIPASVYNEQGPPTLDYGFGNISFEDEEPVRPKTVAAPVSSPVAESIAPAPVLTATEPAFAFFDESASNFSTQVFEEPAISVVQTAAPEFFAPEPPPVVEDPATAVAPVSFTEDQLKAAISAASKEVIERIVWEVVPDLAEALIKEAIRKIREGQ